MKGCREEEEKELNDFSPPLKLVPSQPLRLSRNHIYPTTVPTNPSNPPKTTSGMTLSLTNQPQTNKESSATNATATTNVTKSLIVLSSLIIFTSFE